MLGNRRERREGPYYFTRLQLILLAAGFTAASVVIFLLGMLIGKGIEERKLSRREEPLVKIPVQPLVPGAKTGAAAKDEMTFYDTLAKAPAQAGNETKAVEKAPKIEIKETSPTSKEAKLAKEKPAKEANKEAPAQKPQLSSAKTPPAKPAAPWTVQVNAFTSDKDAKGLVKKLKDKGYDAYVASTKVKGRPWYRVRVGHLENHEQALELQETLKQKENLTKSITTSR